LTRPQPWPSDKPGYLTAWSLVEHFVKRLKALTLFATHYHELIHLVESLPEAKNLTVRTEQKNGKVQFLYELIEQGATQSFGIHVAELAGLPKDVLKRSKEILKELEKDQSSSSLDLVDRISFGNDQLNIFEVPAAIPEHLAGLEKDLKDLDILNLTPLQALQKLHDMKTKILDV